MKRSRSKSLSNHTRNKQVRTNLSSEMSSKENSEIAKYGLEKYLIEEPNASSKQMREATEKRELIYDMEKFEENFMDKRNLVTVIQQTIGLVNGAYERRRSIENTQLKEAYLSGRFAANAPSEKELHKMVLMNDITLNMDLTKRISRLYKANDHYGNISSNARYGKQLISWKHVDNEFKKTRRSFENELKQIKIV